MRRSFLYVFLMLVCHSLSTAQISRPGTPQGINNQMLNTEVPFVELPPIDLYQLHAEDQLLDTISGIPWRFGENIATTLNPDNSGLWETTTDGDRIWRLGIRSPGAYSINLTFDRYVLPPGAELYVYNPDRSFILGAFTEDNNQEDMYFATSLVPGEEVVIEYFEPYGVPFPGMLNLETVTHAYRSIFDHTKSFGNSGSCNLNVACEEAHGWDNEIDAVVLMLVGSNSLCTGTLINNTGFDGRPLLLSANHCYRNPSTLVFWFNWQSTTCENPDQAPPYDALSGAVSRARFSSSDFWLLEFNHKVPIDYNPYFAGWNRTLTSNINGPLAGIHHPRGDIKKFSYALEGANASSYLSGPGTGISHWHITWSGGTTTEMGSSGSPLFDSFGRIIGQLHGGYAACGNTEPDWYGRFGVSWDGGGTTETRLSDWLDPAGRNTLALAGLDPKKLQTLPIADTLLKDIALTDGSSSCYDAVFTITTGGASGPFIAQSGSSAYLIAGEKITMLPGTQLQAGSHVHAYIAPAGPFCEDIGKALVSAENDVTEDVATGFVDISNTVQQQFLHVFPNPTPDRFTIELVDIDPGQDVLIEVYGIRGDRVLRTKLPGDLHQHTLSLEGQVPGIYLVRVVGRQEVGVARLIKR